MHIINISQSQDTDAWLAQRIGKITGTKAGALSMEHYAQKDVAKIEAMAEKAKTDAKRIEYLRKATFDWIETYYNTRRRHSTLGYLTPAEYEQGIRSINQLAA